MARRHGRNGRLMVAIASGGNAELLPFIAAWTAEFTADRTEVTAMGDVGKTYVAGLPDASGTFSGFYDDSTAQTYTAATDGVARKFYLYPDFTSTPGQYWFGTAFFDFSIDSGVGDAAKVSGSWAAASAIIKVG